MIRSKFWDFKTLKKQRTLKGHSDRVTSLKFLTDSGRIISGSEDNCIRIWNAGSSQCESTIMAHIGSVNCLEIYDNEKIIAGSDRDVKIFDLESGQCLHSLKASMPKGFGGPTFCMGLGESSLITAGADMSLRFWDLREDPECMLALPTGHRASITCLSVYGTKAYTGSADETIVEWDLRMEEPIRTLDDHRGPIRAMQCDETRLISGSFDRSIKIFERETGKCLSTIYSDPDSMNHDAHGSVRSLQFNESCIVSGWIDGTLFVYDFSTTSAEKRK